MNGWQAQAFEEFWRLYPRKVGKLAARKQWEKVRPTEALVEMMKATLAWQIETWRDPQFIPHPRTWLSQGRWFDERIGTRWNTPSQDESAEQWVQRVGYCRHQPRCEEAGKGACLERWRSGDGR